ncbi:globin-1-like [Petromyzon marinus]|uniref:Globin-1-like n=1 Tax=Petromyzon marinus TaxID=7757 RepID=A0AAJ7TXE6_PETMA|nr:globin-1-like [Petromyzon marinus]
MSAIVDSGSAPALSGDEKAAIKSTWPSVFAKAEDVGAEMLSRFISSNADVKKYFPKFKDISSQAELKSSAKVRDHAKRIMAFINDLVDNIDNAGAQTAKLHSLSAEHAEKFKVDPQYFKVISNVLLDILGETFGASFSGATRSAWIKLLSIICIGLRSAF